MFHFFLEMFGLKVLNWAALFYFCIPFKKGSVAEWLGRGLQNLLQRFESARNLGHHNRRE
jgi:hypothetical protein